MALTFTSTKAGSSPDYMRYVFGETSGLVRTDRYLDSTLLDFALVPADVGYVHLDRGAYIQIHSTTYPTYFSGYITNEAEASYVGKSPTTGEAVFGYKYQATSDEYILSIKPIGAVPPMLNIPMGQILKSLVERLLPGVFDVTGIQDGPDVAQYVITPDKVFRDVFSDFCTQANFVFWGRDHKLYFMPQDDATLGSIAINGHHQHFTPSRLSIKPSQSPIVNDVTVLGQLEPQTYMHEYFIGTGVTNSFPLVAGVWGADLSVLLQDSFTGNLIDTAKWTAYSGGTPQADPAAVFDVFNNYLNVIGGSGDWLQSVSSIPLEGRLRLTHGEFDFLGSSSGVLGSLWTQEPSSGLTGCLFGLSISGTTLNPIVGGTLDSTQSVTVDSSHRYVIRTVAEFRKTHRVPNKYTYMDSTGTLQSVSASNETDDVIWQTLISEVDPTNGVLTNQWTWRNASSLNGTTDCFAIYVPVLSSGMDLTIGGISISIPIQATLEASTAAPIANLTFDDWTDPGSGALIYPNNWTNYANIFRENVWSQASNALLLQVDGTLEQSVSQAINVNIGYNIIFLAQRSLQASSGDLVFELYGTGWTPTPLTIPVTSIAVAPAFSGTNYVKYEYRLLEPQTAIPADAKLRIKVVGIPDQAVWIDSVTVMSDWQQQLVGANDMDAMDGQAPVATIVAGSSNSQTKSTYTGAPQYNAGQDQLVFFKNSYTYTSTTPPLNQLLRLSYRAAGSAIGRVRDEASITTEATLWGDTGQRATVRTDLQPRPRTSLECQLAAKAILSENSFQHYEGTYTQYNGYDVTIEPKAGMPIKFTNIPGIPFLTAEEVNSVVTTPLCDKQNEIWEHKITFGKPDHIRRLLSKITTPIDSYQQNPASPYADPAYVDITRVALDYIEDVPSPTLRNWDDRYVYLDLGQDLSSDATRFEIRYTDESWGQDGAKNTALITTSRSVTVARNLRGRIFFIRQVNTTTGLTSRYSSCINLSFPVSTGNDYIRDWDVTTIDTAAPVVVGTDLSNNRFSVKISVNEYITVDRWDITLKLGGHVVIDVMRSTDKGTTWTSMFSADATLKPLVPAGFAYATGSNFVTRYLQNDDWLRYDVITADGVASGLTMVLSGRVFTTGSVPLGTIGPNVSAP